MKREAGLAEKLTLTKQAEEILIGCVDLPVQVCSAKDKCKFVFFLFIEQEKNRF